MRRTALAIGAGVALGVVGARVLLVGSAWSLVPWAAVAVALGASASRRRRALRDGAVFGFALAYSFMVVGYSGPASRASRLAPFAVFGLVGAACGAVLALGGAVARRSWPARIS